MARPKEERVGARRWMAIGASSVILFLVYMLFIFGFASAADDETTFAGGLIGIATGLVPATFGCLAVLSQRPRWVRGAALATLLWFVIGGPIAIVDIPTGLVAGFGAGGVVALRRDENHTLTSRAVAVGVCAIYVFVLGLIIPAAALMVGAVLPFLAVGTADAILDREAAATESATASHPNPNAPD